METLRRNLNVAQDEADRAESVDEFSPGGYVCPGCGSSKSIYSTTRPYTNLHMLDVLFFGVLGLISAMADRHGWLECRECGRQFRKRTALITWWIVWCILLAVGAVVIILVSGDMMVEYQNTEAAVKVTRVGEFIARNPVACGLCAVWVVCFTGITLIGLSWRVRRATRRRHFRAN